MNRRSALALTLLSGGLIPARLLGQTRPLPNGRRAAAPAADEAPIDEELDRPAGGFRRPRGGVASTARAEEADPPPDEEELPEEAPVAIEGGLPPDLPSERGQVFRAFDISRYTSLPHESTSPQDALVEWIFRRTGSSVWHGDRIAALSVSRAQLRAYHTPKILRQVEDIVERFNNAQPSDILKLRVRLVSAANPNWRYAVATKLQPVAAGPQGQQVWTLNLEDATMVRTQMQVYQGFKLLEDREVKMINGQTLSIIKEMDVDYISGPQRDSAIGLGFQPGTAKLKEGITLRLSPLLTYEGDGIDLALDFRANTVKALHATKLITPREVGPATMTIDVPEVVETRLNQTIQNWKLGQTLIVSAGIHPGILQSKTGLFNLRIPGTVPTKTELLLFLSAETVGPPPVRSARGRSGTVGS